MSTLFMIFEVVVCLLALYGAAHLVGLFLKRPFDFDHEIEEYYQNIEGKVGTEAKSIWNNEVKRHLQAFVKELKNKL